MKSESKPMFRQYESTSIRTDLLEQPLTTSANEQPENASVRHNQKSLMPSAVVHRAG